MSMPHDQPSEKSEPNWWQSLIAGIFLLLAAVWVIYGEGIQSPLSLGMIPIGLFAAYGIYDSIEDYRTQRIGTGVHPTSSERGSIGDESRYRSILERWQASTQSTSVVIYTWFTAAFAVIFLPPSTEWWVPVRLTVLTLAGGVIWVRTGGEGPPETTKERMKRFGAGIVGILSGLVIALGIRWLFVQFL